MGDGYKDDPNIPAEFREVIEKEKKLVDITDVLMSESSNPASKERAGNEMIELIGEEALVDMSIQIVEIIEHKNESETSPKVQACLENMYTIQKRIFKDGAGEYSRFDFACSYLEMLTGTSQIADIGFDYIELQMLGIEKIASIELGFTIQDDSSYKSVHTSPAKIITSCDAGYNYSNETFKSAMNNGYIEYFKKCTAKKKGQQLLTETAGVRLEAYGFYTKEEELPVLIYEFVNTNNKQLLIGISDVKLNGNMLCEKGWSIQNINPNCREIETMDFKTLSYLDAWEEANITDYKNISFKVSIFDKDYNQVGDTESVSIDLK